MDPPRPPFPGAAETIRPPRTPATLRQFLSPTLVRIRVSSGQPSRFTAEVNSSPLRCAAKAQRRSTPTNSPPPSPTIPVMIKRLCFHQSCDSLCASAAGPMREPAIRSESGTRQKPTGDPQGARVSWRAANRTIRRARRMEPNPRWRPGRSGPLGSGNPKGPDWPFGAEEGHGSSGLSGSRETSADASLQKDQKRQQKGPAQRRGGSAGYRSGLAPPFDTPTSAALKERRLADAEPERGGDFPQQKRPVQQMHQPRRDKK